VALPTDRARSTAPRGSQQLGTEPPTVQRGPSLRLPSDEHLSIDPTHVGPNVSDGPVDPYVGRVLSERYRIIKKIGEGGMGTVYLAEHIVIEKKVALKILSDDLARKGDLVQRFMQEAKAASRIGHENIVDITDFGQTDAGSVFFAMEYLDGGDLATIIREDGPLPFARVRPIMTQICRALGTAHGKGIIHRDMKPENIFCVTRDGRADLVQRFMQEAKPPRASATRTSSTSPTSARRRRARCSSRWSSSRARISRTRSATRAPCRSSAAATSSRRSVARSAPPTRRASSTAI